ncbi:hypothetical protein [Streptomyces griseosporeus]|uniref:hypothetical protein n=1 Tax=Streptomyces griseosporeus TaxID=1910 RepID=UPI003702B3D6
MPHRLGPGTPLSQLHVITRLARATAGAASAVCVLALVMTAPAQPAAATPTPATQAPAAQSLPLDQAIAALPQAAESSAGYDRAKFRYWNAGSNPDDGCDTRGEVLVVEAVSAPTVESGCRLVGGSW